MKGVTLIMLGVGAVLAMGAIKEALTMAEKGKPFTEAIEAAAKRYKVGPGTLAGLLYQESKFNPDSLGAAGDTGMGQTTAIALADLQSLYPGDWAHITMDDLRSSPELQIRAAANFLAIQLDRMKGNGWDAIRAYNVGAHRAGVNAQAGWDYALNVSRYTLYWMAVTQLGRV
jgi:soluble lytic murein transglycosylase-like protein